MPKELEFDDGRRQEGTGVDHSSLVILFVFALIDCIEGVGQFIRRAGLFFSIYYGLVYTFWNKLENKTELKKNASHFLQQ